MKNSILAAILLLVPLASCVNSSSALAWRSVTYQVTPELIGDGTYVAGSPTTKDATVNAEKTTNSETKVAKELTDNASTVAPSASAETDTAAVAQ